MAAPNKQPAGPRPGPAKAHTHAPYESGKPGSGSSSHGGGQGHTKGIVTKPVGGPSKTKLR